MNMCDALRHAEARLTRCFLCGRSAKWRVVFLPTDARVWWDGPAPRPGKVRSFVYGICTRCKRRRDCSDRVENKILALGRTGTETLH